MDTLYVIAAMTRLNCGVEVLCLRAVERDSPGENAQTYSTVDDCIAARNRLWAQAQDTPHPLDLRCVPEDSALPYVKK